MFRVGQKVVCVDPSGKLVHGAIYTVHSFTNGKMTEKLCIRTVEIGGEWEGYYATRFRPIVERKTDIAIFKAMLTPAGKECVS